ncbi:uncharacterized protein DEA37_0007198 [Paragonimus westermani]|uniref:Uncharacterized protein n=1 Tax=Paragonimus westermani TaxID=34504 RepID=A0A5J4P1Y7_9TREM|nr:uncharacterized protein DEA37_0007198 [Paragonimus westermani]
MEGESLTDFGAFAVRQSDPRFRSPGIARKPFGKEALAAHSIKRARRAKSTMSKTELINSYRLLMNEKLRLERFLSIMSKNHEMEIKLPEIIDSNHSRLCHGDCDHPAECPPEAQINE